MWCHSMRLASHWQWVAVDFLEALDSPSGLMRVKRNLG